MQTIELQRSNDFSLTLDSFIGDICNINHISNYYATIEVPVMKAVDCAFSNEATSTLSVSFDFCQEGVCFKVSSNLACFHSQESSDFPAPGSLDESLFLMSLLSDGMNVSDDGKSVSLIFAVRGIDSAEAASRVQTLLNYANVSPTLASIE